MCRPTIEREKWLDELLEVVRAHVRRACSRVPLQHGLTAGLGWFKEVRFSMFKPRVRIPDLQDEHDAFTLPQATPPTLDLVVHVPPELLILINIL